MPRGKEDRDCASDPDNGELKPVNLEDWPCKDEPDRRRHEQNRHDAQNSVRNFLNGFNGHESRLQGDEHENETVNARRYWKRNKSMQNLADETDNDKNRELPD